MEKPTKALLQTSHLGELFAHQRVGDGGRIRPVEEGAQTLLDPRIITDRLEDPADDPDMGGSGPMDHGIQFLDTETWMRSTVQPIDDAARGDSFLEERMREQREQGAHVDILLR